MQDWGVDDSKYIPSEVSPILYSLVPIANPANGIMPSSSWEIAGHGWITWMEIAERKKARYHGGMQEEEGCEETEQM